MVWPLGMTSSCKDLYNPGPQEPHSRPHSVAIVCCVIEHGIASGLTLEAEEEDLIDQVAKGRVEDGRGSLGPMANAPFPNPAHRTGRAQLRHPALRLASPKDPRGVNQPRAESAR